MRKKMTRIDPHRYVINEISRHLAGCEATFMQGIIVFSCIGYGCQTFHLKKGMRRRHSLFVIVPG